MDNGAAIKNQVGRDLMPQDMRGQLFSNVRLIPMPFEESPHVAGGEPSRITIGDKNRLAHIMTLCETPPDPCHGPVGEKHPSLFVPLADDFGLF